MRYSELVDLSIEGDLGYMIYMIALNKKTRIGGMGAGDQLRSQTRGISEPQEQRKGEKRGRREQLEFARWQIAIRGLNSGLTKRRRYAHIGEIKRRLGNNESDLIPTVMRIGCPKEEEDRIDVVVGYGEAA